MPASKSQASRKEHGVHFRRSRTGCVTCRSRGKKCDEEWDDEGHCQRCSKGSWNCSGRVAVSKDNDTCSAPLVAQAQGLAAALNVPPPPVLPAGNSIDTILSPAAAEEPTFLTPFHHDLNSETPSFENLILPSSATAERGLDDWMGFFGDFASPTDHTEVQLGSHIFTSRPFLSQPFGSQPVPYTYLTTSTNSPQVSIFSSSEKEHQVVRGENMELITPGSGDSSKREGVSLSEIYGRVVQSWLIGVPSSSSEAVLTRIVSLRSVAQQTTSAHSRALQSGSYALALAYIFLLSRIPSAGPDNPRSQPLVELARRGAGDVALTTTTSRRLNLSAGDKWQKDSMARLRMYMNNVSVPFDNDVQAKKWTHEAVSYLKQVKVDDRAQLSDLLWGVIDVQAIEFIRGGAAPSYAMLALGDRLVRHAFGERHPTISLALLKSAETFSLRLYALSDLSRCIVNRGQRTIFNFWRDDVLRTVHPRSFDTEDDGPWSTYLGLPDSIIVLLAEIVNLVADLPSLTKESITEQADELANALKDWSPHHQSSPLAPSAQEGDSMALVMKTIAGELWRQSAIVLLYQSVYRVGPVHSVLRKAQVQILELLESINQFPKGTLWAFVALPAFLAATLSTTDTDRKRCMDILVRPGPEKVWLDNIVLIEKLWEEADEKGYLVDWWQKMKEDGLSVAFF